MGESVSPIPFWHIFALSENVGELVFEAKDDERKNSSRRLPSLRGLGGKPQRAQNDIFLPCLPLLIQGAIMAKKELRPESVPGLGGARNSCFFLRFGANKYSAGGRVLHKKGRMAKKHGKMGLMDSAK